jgi:hypothetical protein
MVKPPSPIANMLSQAVTPPVAGVPFKQGVATPPPKKAPPPPAKKAAPPFVPGAPKKAPPPKSKPGGGGRGNMANFRGKHAPPFAKKS